MSQQESYPNAAYILSLIAGIFVLLGGLVLAVIGAAFTFFVFGVGAVIGIFGIVFGIIMITAAMNLRSHPGQHATWGAVILVFSIISWFGAFGGFFLGFLLGLIGGILALVWSPPRTQATPSYAASSYSAPPPPTSTARYCPYCGAPVSAGTKFCPNCGRELP